jgi:hypothetical protein
MEKFPGYILPATPSLYELRASLSGGNSDPQTDPLTLTQRTVLNAPNLRSLKISLNSQGCVVYLRLTEFPMGTLGRGDRYPPLEELRLQGYWFTHRGVENWTNVMDWTHLHTLEIGERCGSLPFLQAMVPAKLPALAFIKLVFPYFRDSSDEELYLAAVRTFLIGAPEHGLEDLALQGRGYQKIFRDVVAHHAITLRTLSLHDRERVDGDQREMLSVEDLLWLDMTCGNLESLAVDINPKLSHATIESPSNPTNAVRTRLSLSSAWFLTICRVSSAIGENRFLSYSHR